MYLTGWVEISVVVLLIWLIILSYFFWQSRRFLNQLFPKKIGQASDASLLIREQFEALLTSVEEVSKREKILRKKIKEVALDGLGHIQIVEVSKYNPYADTGGNISFSAVFLNGKLDGIILTSLHSRSGTRIYVKDVKSGKTELELSKEEKELLKKVTIK